jgi:hypothetical protein
MRDPDSQVSCPLTMSGTHSIHLDESASCWRSGSPLLCHGFLFLFWPSLRFSWLSVRVSSTREPNRQTMSWHNWPGPCKPSKQPADEALNEPGGWDGFPDQLYEQPHHDVSPFAPTDLGTCQSRKALFLLLHWAGFVRNWPSRCQCYLP